MAKTFDLTTRLRKEIYFMIMICFVAAKNSCDANAKQKTKTWTYVKHAFKFSVELKS